MARFIRIANKAVNVDQIAYVDFLESGRAMVFISGLTQEKQHIPVEPAEARMLQEFLDREYSVSLNSALPAGAMAPAMRSLAPPRF
jgi:hypothetical protein